MSVMIAKGASFLGVPLIKVRNVLKAWHRATYTDIWRIAERNNVDLDPRTIILLLEELRDRGVIGPEEQEHGSAIDGLTESGLALAAADARSRTPQAKALKILDTFLDACMAINARSDLPFEIQEVWLFGSMINPAKADVGDIDLAIVQTRTAAFQARAFDRYGELADEMGAPAGMPIWLRVDFVERHLLFGRQRHPLLSLSKMDELRDMGCPCQLIFDESRGGRVSDLLLDRHPASPGRSKRMGDKRRMPELTANRQAIRPVSASLTAARCLNWSTIEALQPWEQDHTRYAILRSESRKVHIITDDTPFPDLKVNALTKRMRFTNCDGRSRFGLIVTERVKPNPDDWLTSFERPMVALIVERTIREEASKVLYCLDIVGADHLRPGIDYSNLLMAEWWLYLVITTDIERILRRDREIGVTSDVTCNASNRTASDFAETLMTTSSLLTRPYVEEVRSKISASLSEPTKQNR